MNQISPEPGKTFDSGRWELALEPDILKDLFILKRDITIVDAADVGEHDVEMTALELIARRDAA